MSRITPLFDVDSFRNSVSYLLGLTEERLRQIRGEAEKELAATTNVQPQSENDLAKRAIAILIEAAARDGIDEIGTELQEKYDDEGENLDALIRVITPGEDTLARIRGIEERDAFLPILTGHRLALDLRVTEGPNDTPVATPFVTARLTFDATIASGTDAVVFQLNIAELEPLERALAEIRSRADRLVASTGEVSVLKAWGHDAS